MVNEIEKDLIQKRLERLKRMPAVIFKQLDRIEKRAFEIWKLDTVFTGSVMLDSLDACSCSKLTLDQLERLMNLRGQEYKTFTKFLNKAVKIANRRKPVYKTTLISRIFGKVSRNKEKVRPIRL